MGKASSSAKKKGSKYSSPGRKQKRSKSKRTKSKKLRQRDDSDSYSDYDSSSTSVSSSSSEVNYKSRRSRSYTRRDAKTSRKKSRARSSSSDGSPRVRKRKRLKRNDEYEGRKKTNEKSRKKKKTKRDPNISSRSNGSRSCSTCQSAGDRSEDSEYERRMSRPDRRDSTRKLEKVKSRTQRKRYSSSSSSSYSRQNEDIGRWSEKETNYEVTSKRLRSVVIVAKQDNEGRDMDKDEHKEEMTYDRDDYPSSRSNDSNDGGINRDLAHQSSLATEKKDLREDDQEDYVVAPKMTAIEVPESDKDGEGHNAASKHESDRVRTDKSAINDGKNEISEVICGKDNDLESILRQRALENLKRFRGGSQITPKSHVNPKNDSGSALNPSLATEAQSDQIASSENDGARAAQEGSSHSSWKDDNVTELNNAVSGSVSFESKVHSPDGDTGRANASATTVQSRIKRPRLVASALKQALSDAGTTPTAAGTSRESNERKSVIGNRVRRGSAQASHVVNPQSDNDNLDKVINVSSRLESFDAAVNPEKATASEESNRANMATGSTVGEGAIQTAHATPISSNSKNTKVKKVTGSGSIEPSCVGSPAGDNGPNKLEDEGKEDSQLQQKTMSVMRGGELVQVSYKVYIPKKGPALARRPLKR